MSEFIKSINIRPAPGPEIPGRVRPKSGKTASVIEDTVEIGDTPKLGLTDKSAMGLAMLGDRLYQTPGIKEYYNKKNQLIQKTTDLVMKPIKAVMEWIAGDKDKEKLDEVRQAGRENLEKFPKHMKNFPSRTDTNKSDNDNNSKATGEDKSFWERNPLLHSLYIGAMAVQRIPSFAYKLALKIPRAIFKVVFPALYASDGSDTNFVGKGVYDKIVGWANKNTIFRRGYETCMKMMQVPGVALAVGIMTPLYGASRIVDGLNIYKEGVKEKDATKRLGGKVEMISGGLMAIKPLAIFAILTQGIHAYLNHKINNGTLDPEKADKIMTRALSLVAAPIGLAAYALLKPGQENKPADPKKSSQLQATAPKNLVEQQGYIARGALNTV